MKKLTFLSKCKQNDRQNVIVEPVFINLKYLGAIKLYMTNKHTYYCTVKRGCT